MRSPPGSPWQEDNDARCRVQGSVCRMRDGGLRTWDSLLRFEENDSRCRQFDGAGGWVEEQVCGVEDEGCGGEMKARREGLG